MEQKKTGFNMLKRASNWEARPNPALVVSSRPSTGIGRAVGYSPTFRHEVIAPPRWNRMVESVVAHIFFIVLLVTIGKLMPAPPRVQPVKLSDSTTLYAPYKPRVVPKITAPPPKVLAKLTPPPKLVTPEPPKVEPPKIEPPKVEPKPVEVAKAPAPRIPVPAPKKEIVTNTFASAEVVKPVEPKKKEVVTNTFASGSSEPPTVHKPAREVQTGGFGDPNGLPGTSDKPAKLTVASVGSFDLPSGAGHGNGTGGAHGMRGTIVSAGFGDGIAGVGSGDHGRKGTVTQSGFGEVTSAGSGGDRTRARAEAKPAETPVEIQFKPKPVYTQEARKLRVEGEVLLEVMFEASGNIQVQRVVRGLGHGLDEAAQRAAQQVRFTPAKRDGRAYDSMAMVHIVFQLAE